MIAPFDKRLSLETNKDKNPLQMSEVNTNISLMSVWKASGFKRLVTRASYLQCVMIWRRINNIQPYKHTERLAPAFLLLIMKVALVR